MLKTFLTLLVGSLVLSFHETLWVWAPVPMGVALLMIYIGLLIERKELERRGY